MTPLRPTLYRRIELCANIVIVLSGLLLAGRVLKPDLFSFSTEERPSIRAGARLALPQVDWSQHDKHLVLVLSRGCRFCAESAPFYQKLVAQAKQSSSLHLMALLPQEPTEAQQYLARLQLPISDIRQARLAALNVSGTPTLLLLDRKGVVQQVWVGKLSSRREADVLQTLAD